MSARFSVLFISIALLCLSPSLGDETLPTPSPQSAPNPLPPPQPAVPETPDTLARPASIRPTGAIALLDSLRVHYAPEAQEDLDMSVNFRFLPDNEPWSLKIAPGRIITLSPETDPTAAFVFTMTRETLRSIYEGKISASTALYITPGETPLLQFQPLAGAARLTDMPGTMMEFVQRFFNSTRPEITHFDEAHSRVVRGTNVVALYNAVGLRSSWYLIKPDQRLKEPGVAYPQALIFLSGHGTARIGDQTIPIKGGESYYVAPGSDREIWTEGEPLTLIRIAWGKGA